MKLSPTWLREFVAPKIDDRQLADDLTLAGIAVEGISGEGEAMVFEMEITTNRPDAMNHYGVAREASAIYSLPLQWISPKLPAAQGKTEFRIEIEDAAGCARYTGRILRGVTIRPSPQPMVQRLASLDQRAINNAADASNYTLWEMGHPTHAFDLDWLEGGKIVVRRARDGETLKTLDGIERRLTRDDLVIADAKKPVALAGVMGGFDSMITERTKNILIESAWFDPVTVRKMAKRHGMHTDASHRFERGADCGATPLACDRVAELILASGGGQLEGGVIDAIAAPRQPLHIELRRAEVTRILGKQLGDEEIINILTRLGFALTLEDYGWSVQVPSWRLDIEREIDLIEELARLHGYDKFENRLPAYVGSVIELLDAAKDAKLRATLLALGYNETISLTFISRHDAAKFSPTSNAVELTNPLSEEASVMRTSMVPGMLNMLAYNLNRGAENVRLFEAGNVFEMKGSKVDQRKTICLGVTLEDLKTNLLEGHILDFEDETRKLDVFRSFKGDVEVLLNRFDCNPLRYEARTTGYYFPGQSACALVGEVVLASFGQVHTNVAAARKLRQPVFVAEFDLKELYRHGLREPRYRALPRYPAVERDFSFVFADAVSFEAMQDRVEALHIAELRSFVPGPEGIYRGADVREGKYSLLLRATFQSGECTLREEEVAQWSAQVIQALQELGGTLRSS